MNQTALGSTKAMKCNGVIFFNEGVEEAAFPALVVTSTLKRPKSVSMTPSANFVGNRVQKEGISRVKAEIKLNLRTE